MLTDPVRDVETDRYRRIILCKTRTTYLFSDQLSWMVDYIRVRHDQSPYTPTTARLKTSSPKGQRYAY